MIRWTGLTMLGLALAVTLTAAQDDPKDRVNQPKENKGKADDRDRLQGRWITIAIEEDGKRVTLTKSERDLCRTTFAGDRYTERNGNKKLDMDGTFKVDPSKQPKTIDLIFKGLTLQGIYEVEDDALRICLSPAERPTEFKSKGAIIVCEYRRERPEEKLEPRAKGEAQPRNEGGGDPKTEELIQRVKDNMARSEERLDKKDPYDETRQIQRDIIKDLDELIEKQNQNDQNNGGGGGGASNSNDKSGGSSGKSGRRSKGNQSSQANKGGAKGQDQAKGGNKGGQDQDPKNGKGGQDQAKDNGKGGQDQAKGQNSKSKTGGMGVGASATGKNTIADLFKDIWGHLPQTKRMEMDAYSKERFMPKYDDLLRQYYRTIAEQGRKKEGD